MIQSVDFYLLNIIQRKLRCRFLDFLMVKISALGNGGIIWIVSSALLMLNKDYRKSALAVIAGLAVGVVAGNLILKNIVARPRPFRLRNDVTLLIPKPRDYSFPSCHTMSSFTSAIILACINKSFGYAAIPLAGLIAFSRMYLYVHYPSDILGGVVLGAVIAFALCALMAV